MAKEKYISADSPTRRLMVLLPIAPRFDAFNGTGRATAQLLAELTTRHCVALVYLRSADEPGLDDTLRERCDLVEEVLRPGYGNSFTQRIWHGARLIGSMFCGRPMWVTDWNATAFHTKIRGLVQTWQPDIIQLEYHVMGQYLPSLDGYPAPRILVEHDPGIKAAPYLQNTHNIIGRLLHYVDVLAWYRFEKAVIRQVQTVVVFTQHDQQVITPLAKQTPIVRIPIGTVCQATALSTLGDRPLSLVFVGNFKHTPNVDAAERLIREILPRVQVHHPEVRLYIVGDQPPPRIKQLANKQVIVTGCVPDVMPYLDRAALVVVPLRLGGGMRVKVLEALAAGKAVVASPLAVEGLNVVDGEQVMVAESDDQFAQKIVQLLANSERRAALATRAFDWSLDNLGWDKSLRAYETLYEQLLEQSPAAGIRQ